jgi:two-component system, chemotaxis family, sensor kinase CheA
VDSMADIKQTFFQECDDLLGELESGLLDMESGDGDSDTVAAIFRAVHSIKGGAGAFGLDKLVAFAHIFETTLDEVRADRLEATPEVLSVLLRSSDVLADLVRAAQNDEELGEEATAGLVEELSAFVGDKASAPDETPAGEDISFAPLGTAIDLDDAFGDLDDDVEETKSFIIKFRPMPELYANANETVLLFRNLAEMGDLNVACDESQIPTLDEIDPEGAYLSWTITVDTSRSEAELLEIFEFVEDDCTLEIKSADASDAAIEPEVGEDEAISAKEEAQDTDIESAKDDADPVDVVVSKDNVVSLDEKKQKTAESAKASKEKDTSDATIRVNLGRVDRLVNLVGELVINQAMLTQGVIDAGLERGDSVEAGLEELKQLTREIQDSVMAIRAQPVKALFQRMSRIVREAARATGKSVHLVMEGEMTEVDKTVVERLADPLTHMIRNAVDHGLEKAETRIENGKPAEGTVSLTAAHRSGRVVIEVCDDGAGINRERVRKIAIDKGLISEEDKLSDSDIDNLLFMPGFSTVEKVSNLSGRGVGMDVVKRAIQAVGGKISISSQPGKGSTFSISLPLTLAILDGMVVEVADQTLVVPLTAIVETLKPTPSDIHELGAGAKVISIRGEFIPIIDAGRSMGYRAEPADPLNGVVLSVETEEGARAAVIVDTIQDQRQVVIKSLEENYGHVDSVAAATILGDGRIALILDVDSIIACEGTASSFQETSLAATG